MSRTRERKLIEAVRNLQRRDLVHWRPVRGDAKRTIAIEADSLGLPVLFERGAVGSGDYRTLCHVGVPDEHAWTFGRWERLRDRLPSMRRRRAA